MDTPMRMIRRHLVRAYANRIAGGGAMEYGILSQKGSGMGRGVNEKDLNRNKKNTSSVDMTVEMGKQNSLDDTTILEFFPPLSTLVTTTAGNALIYVVVLVDSIRAISERFANTAYGFFLGKKVAYPIVANYEDVSTVPVWVKLHGVPITAFSKDGLSAIATKLGTPLMFDSYTSDMCMQSWCRSTYARVMIELHADVELKDNIVVALHKITREGHYTCNVCVEYEWKAPWCLSLMCYKSFKFIVLVLSKFQLTYG
ncbi:kinase-like domain, phloem protein 2-like protein [Tanacetum coccineum]